MVTGSMPGVFAASKLLHGSTSEKVSVFRGLRPRLIVSVVFVEEI
jgi:hypothetical protein